MRLKGKLLERLPPEKRERMERTLKRMEEIRRNDDMRIRELISAKKKWTEEERKKGLDIIAKLEQQIEDIKRQLLKLDGCLLALNDLESDIHKMDEEIKAKREKEAKQAEEEANQLKDENKQPDEENSEKSKHRKRVTKKK